MLMLADGTFSIELSDYETPDSAWKSFKKSIGGGLLGGNVYFDGFQAIEDVFSYCVTENLEHYTYENHVQE